jgi:acetyl-CoA decarbonylase/synthase complex subunit gamma
MSYRVEPGLYAVGDPGPGSPVLVTASYKLSFDILRREAGALDAWILVLDTAGVNVWCAAGKGTFGTAELVHRIAATRLAEVVEHRRLIVPQLGGPGVAGFEVKKASGFKVIWGPVDAADLPEFLESGCRATAEMRRKSFGLGERLRLVPVELVTAAQWVILASLVLLLIGGLGSGSYLSNLLDHGLRAVLALIGGVVAGAVIMPAMLPWLPGRSFALKGLWPGLAVALALLLGMGYPGGWAGRLEGGAWLLMVPAVSAFLAMGFTGASTFTSLSGVRKEMRVAVPMQISAASLGVALWLASRLVA